MGGWVVHVRGQTSVETTVLPLRLLRLHSPCNQPLFVSCARPPPLPGGNSRTSIIACISPSEESAQETHGTLVFASGAKKIRNKVGAVVCTSLTCIRTAHQGNVSGWGFLSNLPSAAPGLPLPSTAPRLPPTHLRQIACLANTLHRSPAHTTRP